MSYCNNVIAGYQRKVTSKLCYLSPGLVGDVCWCHCSSSTSTCQVGDSTWLARSPTILSHEQTRWQEEGWSCSNIRVRLHRHLHYYCDFIVCDVLIAHTVLLIYSLLSLQVRVVRFRMSKLIDGLHFFTGSFNSLVFKLYVKSEKRWADVICIWMILKCRCYMRCIHV